MAARSPRRIFANPFVITLAAAPACFASSNPPPPQQAQAQPLPVMYGDHDDTGPDHINPPPPVEQEIPTTNPPAPQQQPAPPPARPRPSAPQRWIVTKSGAACFAREKFECPKVSGNDPMPTCNPPPAMSYECPPGMADKATLTVAQYSSSTVCVVEQPPPNCPPNATCNPPPPQRVACPKR